MVFFGTRAVILFPTDLNSLDRSNSLNWVEKTVKRPVGFACCALNVPKTLVSEVGVTNVVIARPEFPRTEPNGNPETTDWLPRMGSRPIGGIPLFLPRR